MVKWGESTSQSQTRPRRVRPCTEGDGAAEAGVLQQLPRLEALPAFQRHSLSHFADGDEDALLHFAAGAHEPQARPHPHGLGRIGARRLRPGVLHQQRILRRSPAILSLVDLQSLGVGDDQADLRFAPPREALPGHLHGFAQRHLLCLVHSQPLKEGEDPLVEAPPLRELVAPAAGQVVQ